MQKASVHVWIYGTVQGVFFRANAKDQATQLGLVGWIKNLPTGEVEGYAEGLKTNLEKWIKWCHVGPTQADVLDVKVVWGKKTDQFFKFDII